MKRTIMIHNWRCWFLRLRRREVLVAICLIALTIYGYAFTTTENESFLSPPTPALWLKNLLQNGAGYNNTRKKIETKDGSLGNGHVINKQVMDAGRHGSLLFRRSKEPKTSKPKINNVKQVSEWISKGDLRHYFVNNSFYHEEKQVVPQFNLTIPCIDACTRKTEKDTPDVYLLALVFSPPEDASFRLAMRRSWLAHDIVKGYRVVSVFLVGKSTKKESTSSLQKKISQESKDYHDIIQGDFIDSASNQSLKLLMGLRWASSYCPNVKFILKLDHRTLPVYSNIVPLLESVPEDGVCLGKILNDTKVIRNKDSQLYVPKSVYKDATYLPHPSKSGYIFAASMVNYILNISPHIQYFSFDDVYIAMLIKTVGVGLDHRPEFEMSVNEADPDACVIEQALTLTLPVNCSSNDVMNVWKSRGNPVDKCKQLSKQRQDIHHDHDHDLFE